MGNMGDLAILLVGIVDALFAFFVVAPILLNTASLFGVQHRPWWRRASLMPTP